VRTLDLRSSSVGIALPAVRYALKELQVGSVTLQGDELVIVTKEYSTEHRDAGVVQQAVSELLSQLGIEFSASGSAISVPLSTLEECCRRQQQQQQQLSC
jgi:predicted transcriptional regulator